jgi:cell shape-determining protein MreD
MQDSLSAGPFGVTAAVYATITALLTGMHQAFDRELPWVQMGAGALLTAATGAAAGVVVGFSAGATVKILALATFSTLITPLLFLFLDWLLASWRRT